MARNLGTLYYQAELGKDKKTAQVVPKGTKTEVHYNGETYTTPLEWLAQAFSNSGKYIIHNPTSMSAVKPVDTPRATRYIPPKDRHSFGRFV
jgi:hypothetical protein